MKPQPQPSRNSGNGRGLRVGLVTQRDELADRLASIANAGSFVLTRAATTGDLRALAAERAITVALLDWEAGEFTALDDCTALRCESSFATVSIIIVSGWTHNSVCMRALDAGADDYVAESSIDAELVARLRRASTRARSVTAGGLLAYEDIVMDLDRWRVFRGEHVVALHPVEFKVLRALLEQPERVVSRDQLKEVACHRPADSDVRTVDAYVRRIRTKLASVKPDVPVPIRTVRPIGYSIDVRT